MRVACRNNSVLFCKTFAFVVLCSCLSVSLISTRLSLSVSRYLSLFYWFLLFSKAVTFKPNGCAGKLCLHWFSVNIFFCPEPHSKTWVIGLQNILIKTLSDWLRTAETGLLHQGEAALTHSPGWRPIQRQPAAWQNGPQDDDHVLLCYLQSSSGPFNIGSTCGSIITNALWSTTAHRVWFYSFYSFFLIQIKFINSKMQQLNTGVWRYT